MVGERYIPIPDWFEQERPMQPKKAVGDYVETQGILLPRRFDSFEEGLYSAQNGTPVIARSEHPDEYGGPSGLGYSGHFDLDENGLMNPRYPFGKKDVTIKYKRYAQVSGTEEPQIYAAQTSESYWQSIPGINVTCVADDAVEGRYHIFGYRHRSSDGKIPTILAGAIAEENGEVLRITHSGVSSEQFIVRFKDVIDFYNTVRCLDRFNPSHCPVMEMQLADEDGKLYFLQYHRARDAEPVNERLDTADYDERDGWIKAETVRGAYLGGKALQLAMWYKGLRGGKANAWGMEFPEDGSTSVDMSFWTLDEAIGRQRIAHLISSNFEREYEKIAASHGPRSRMFKPQLSMLTNPLSKYNYIPEELSDQAIDLAMDENKEVRIKTDVVSDGRIGYFRYGKELTVID